MRISRAAHLMQAVSKAAGVWLWMQPKKSTPMVLSKMELNSGLCLAEMSAFQRLVTCENPVKGSMKWPDLLEHHATKTVAKKYEWAVHFLRA